MSKFKKLGIIGLGIASTETLNHVFDFIMYPLVIGFMGPLRGGIVMTGLALWLNYGLVVGYHKTKHDWFGFEWLALKRQEEAKTLSGRLLRFLLRLGHWPAFVFLCWEDPFKAFIFVRGRKASGFKFDKTDWAWFVFVNVLGNLIWVLIVWGVLDIVKNLLGFS